MVIGFKTPALIDDWHRLDPKLQDVLIDCGADLLITSLIRDGRNDNELSVHYHGRGADARSWNMTRGEAEALVERVNEAWVYDPERPGKKACIMHDVGQGEHIHFQVHPNTIKRIYGIAV